MAWWASAISSRCSGWLVRAHKYSERQASVRPEVGELRMLPSMTSANESGDTILGIDIGGSSIKAVVVRGDQVQSQAASDRYEQADASTLRSALTQVSGRLGDFEASRVGMCVPGVFDPQSRQVSRAVNVPGLIGLDLDTLGRGVAPLAQSVEICSDAQAAALGYWHAHPAQDRMLALVMGTGVGLCVLDAGEPLRVTGESSGHFGQIDVGSFDPTRPTASDASTSTLEAYVGLRALLDRFGDDGVTGWLKAPMSDPSWRALIGAIRVAHAIYRPNRIVLLGGVGERLGARGEVLHREVCKGLTTLAHPGWKLESGSATSGAVGAARWAERMVQKRSQKLHVYGAADRALERTVGRLLWVGIRGSQPGEPVLEAELERCRRAHVGGVILFDVDLPQRDRLVKAGVSREESMALARRNISDPGATRVFVEYLRHRLGPHLVVSLDQEGGAVCRLKPERGYPPCPPPCVYASLDESSRAAASNAMAEALAMVGVDLNLAPCIDLGIDGSVSGTSKRCFASDPEIVARMAAEQIQAMRRAGVGSCLKHFPGHGSATGDTHHSLVDITRTWERNAELTPYRRLLNGSVTPDAVMVAHLMHTKLDQEYPASLSYATITGLLREHLGWQGLVITDSLDMRAIADHYPRGEAAVLAIMAGADVALDGNNLENIEPCPAPEMHAALMQAVHEGRLSRERLEQSVARLDTFCDRSKGCGT